MEYKSKNHTVYRCTYHVVFCPKYRRRILKDGIDTELKTLMHEFSQKKNFEILEMEVMPDHVHLLVDLFPDYAPLEMVRQMKHYTAKMLKRKFPEINSKLPNLWTRSAFVSTTGGAPLEVIKEYIENQKGK